MKKHIICLGDSNTHGYCADPADCADGALSRYNESERWTCLLQKKLGEEYLVLEEGLSGRTTVFADPLHEGMPALDYIYPCLKSHEPVSLLIIMLGTNDTKDRLGQNAACIALGMERLIKKAQTVDCWGPNGRPNILIICPPPIGRKLNDAAMGVTCPEKSEQLPEFLKPVAERNGCFYLDAGELGVEFNRVDYMHLTREAHAKLAEILAQKVPQWAGK